MIVPDMTPFEWVYGIIGALFCMICWTIAWLSLIYVLWIGLKNLFNNRRIKVFKDKIITIFEIFLTF